MCKEIFQDDPLYQKQRELRNDVLLRPHGLPDFHWEMNDKDSFHYVGIQKGDVISCAILFPNPENKKNAQLMQMAVAEKMQGKGIGRQLLDYIIESACMKGIEYLTCHARDYAVGFYAKAGFKVVGEPFEEIGIPHSHMILQIDTRQIGNLRR